MSVASSHVRHCNKYIDFGSSIQNLVEICSKDSSRIFDMNAISNHLCFHHRRFYDVISVLEVIGCCVKIDTHWFIWNGLESIKETFMAMASKNGAFLQEKKLDLVIPNFECISIGNVTLSFILLFFALQNKKINIKQAALYLSRHNKRSKTTLCKIYQVTHVCEALGIMRKTKCPGEFKISSYFYISPDSSMSKYTSKYAIESLLNHKATFEHSAGLYQRRIDYEEFRCEGNVLSNQCLSP